MITRERKLTIREIRVYLWLRHRARERSIRRFIHRFIFLIPTYSSDKWPYDWVAPQVACQCISLPCNALFSPKKDHHAW